MQLVYTARGGQTSRHSGVHRDSRSSVTLLPRALSLMDATRASWGLRKGDNVWFFAADQSSNYHNRSRVYIYIYIYIFIALPCRIRDECWWVCALIDVYWRAAWTHFKSLILCDWRRLGHEQVDKWRPFKCSIRQICRKRRRDHQRHQCGALIFTSSRVVSYFNLTLNLFLRSSC